MNVEFADRIMLKFNITIVDLISEEEMLNSLDEKDPDWLGQAAKRKPPEKAARRENADRSPWRGITRNS